MKKIFLLVAIVAIIALAAFQTLQAGSIRGTIIPSDAASQVWAISNRDTLKGDVNVGGFEITNVREGTYTVIVYAKPPFKTFSRANVQVTRGGTTDLGAINLER